MPAVEPRVEMLAYTPNPRALVYTAFRQCYRKGSAIDFWPDIRDGVISGEEQARFIANVLSSGHESPVEHISFTFALSGVSRALTHQLVRHRVASYSQQSQRYVGAEDFDYLIPPAIRNELAACERFIEVMDEINRAYREIQTLLKDDGRTQGQANEDARFVLPNAAATNIVFTMNARELLHFFEQRCCARAQWEIRWVAEQMLTQCRGVVPELFKYGAKCERLGYCPENEDFSCGLYPTKEGRV